jgi:hypothetical protein
MIGTSRWFETCGRFLSSCQPQLPYLLDMDQQGRRASGLLSALCFLERIVVYRDV